MGALLKAYLEHGTLQHKLEKVPEEFLVSVPTRHTAEILFLDSLSFFGAVNETRQILGRQEIRLWTFLGHLPPRGFCGWTGSFVFHSQRHLVVGGILISGHICQALPVGLDLQRRERFPLYVMY